MTLPHAVPLNDAIKHDVQSGDCPCGPRAQPSTRGDGTVGLVVVHHSLDGREVHAPGQDS